MKKLGIKTGITLSLLFATSMASASGQSWTDRANDTWESGKEYARPVYNYARNNPGRTVHFFVRAGLLSYILYWVAPRIKAEVRKAGN